jgi:MFS family permease
MLSHQQNTINNIAGDIVAPLLLAGLALAGASWRAAFAIVAAVLAAVVALLCAAPLADIAGEPGRPADEDDDGASDSRTAETGLWARLRDALSDRLLVAWLFGCALCDLLDEILLVFASLHVRGTLGASAVEQSVVIGAFMAGAALGLVAVELLLRARGERPLLVAFSLATIAAFVPWMLSPSIAVAIVLAMPVGFASAPLYPLAAAQAYARRPQQSGSVLAASHLFTPLGLALPWLVGVVADQAGTTAALALLVAQPLGLVVLVAISSRDRG